MSVPNNHQSTPPEGTEIQNVLYRKIYNDMSISVAITDQPHGAVNTDLGKEKSDSGLDYLAEISELHIRQESNLCEAVTGLQIENQYFMNTQGSQKIIKGKEKSNCFMRCCFTTLRPFEMKLYNNTGKEIIHLDRALACQNCCFPCCLQNLGVYNEQGQLLGEIKQEWSLWSQKFSIQDPSGEILLRIGGPCEPTSCGLNVDFQVFSGDGLVQVATISKLWSGCAKEFCTDFDEFVVIFDKNIVPKMKALILGAAILIEYMFFEKPSSTALTLLCTSFQICVTYFRGV